MSTAAIAAALAAKAGAVSASGTVVRRSRVRSLDGLTRTLRTVTGSGSSTPAQTRSLEGSPNHAKGTSGAITAGARRRVRSRSLASPPHSGYATAARVTARGGPSGDLSVDGPRWLAVYAAAAAAAAAIAAGDARENECDSDRTGGWPRGRGDGSRVQCRAGSETSPRARTRATTASVSQGIGCGGVGHTSFGVEAAATVTADNGSAGSGSTIRSAQSYGTTNHGDDALDDDDVDHGREREEAEEEFLRMKGLEKLRGNRKGGGAAVAAAAAAVAVARAVHEESATAATTNTSITDVYRFESGGEPVGKGHRSTVFECTHRLTGQSVAVKKISRAETSRLEASLTKRSPTHLYSCDYCF